MRLFGRWPGGPANPLQGNPYDPEVTKILYEQLLPAQAEGMLAAGFSVVVDATFLKRSQRSSMAELAKRERAEFRILHCAVSEDLAVQRINKRLLKALIRRKPISRFWRNNYVCGKISCLKKSTPASKKMIRS